MIPIIAMIMAAIYILFQKDLESCLSTKLRYFFACLFSESFSRVSLNR